MLDFFQTGLILVGGGCALLLTVFFFRRGVGEESYHKDLCTLSLWLQNGEPPEGRELLTTEGRDLADQFLRRLEDTEKVLHGLQHASLTDDLTGLLNRRGIRNRLAAEHNRVQRQGGGYALLLFDIDNFKEVNDNFGHAAGDLVLRQLADLVAGVLRCSDDCGRWGGEEFLVLLPNTSFHDAYQVAEKLSREISASLFYLEDTSIGITVTVGIAVDGGQFPIDEVVNQADLRLYQGKRNGRNCIVPCHHPPPNLLITSAGVSAQQAV